MSFFDEDDEPPRTARTRARPIAAAAPRPGHFRRVVGRPDRAGPADDRRHRRPAGPAAARSSSSRRATTRATRTRCEDYNRQVTQIGTESQQTGERVLQADGQRRRRRRRRSSTVDPRATRAPRDAVAQAGAGPERAGRHDAAQQSLLIALELRRDGAAGDRRATSGPRSATRATRPTRRSTTSPARCGRSTPPTSCTTRASSRS